MVDGVSATPRRATSGSGRLAGLDALRGIAALCIVSFHAVYTFGDYPSPPGKGYLAVDFFFMLSGYVMARTYERRLAEGYGTRRFMLTRYRRLWPVLSLGTLLGAPLLIVELGGLQHAWLVILANFLLLPAVAGQLIFPANGPAWSICFELLANLFHGLILWRWSTGRLAALMAGMAAIMVWISLQFGNFGVGPHNFDWFGGIPRVLLSYTAGIIMWRWWQDRPSIAVRPTIAFAAMPVLLIASLAFDAQSWLWDMAFVALVCPLLIAGGLAWRGDHWLARWSGMVSFPLYAVHQPMLSWAQGLGMNLGAGVALALLVAAYITLKFDSGAKPAAPRAVAAG